MNERSGVEARKKANGWMDGYFDLVTRYFHLILDYLNLITDYFKLFAFNIVLFLLILK